MEMNNGSYDLMWLTTAYGPYFGDIGLGIGLVKVAGNTAKALPLCPALLRLDPDRDTPLMEWHRNSGGQAMGGLFPKMEPCAELERVARAWTPHLLKTDYRYRGIRVQQEVVVGRTGVYGLLEAERAVALVLEGESFDACKVRRIPDGLHVVECAPVLAPLEFTVKFNVAPVRVTCGGVALDPDHFTCYSAKTGWAFHWDTPLDELEISVDIQRSFSPEVPELAPLPRACAFSLSRAAEPVCFPDRRARQQIEWADFFTRDVPAIDCPDPRVARLAPYLAWVHRSNTIHHGGILPYPYSIPKQTFVGWWSWDTAKSAIAGAWYGNRAVSWGGLLNTENLHYPARFGDGGVVTNSARFNGVDCWPSPRADAPRFPVMPYAVPEEHGSGTHPPMFSLALWSLWTVDGNDILMQRLLDSAFKYDRYFERIRASEQIPGLLVVRRWSDSGMDNSKRWANQNNRGVTGRGYFEDVDWELPVISVDLNVYNITEKRCLADMCRAAGLEEKAAALDQEAREREEVLHRELWSAARGSYFDRIEADGRFSPIVSPTNLSPLMLRGLPRDRIQPLLRWLFDENHFWTEYPLPSISRSDPDFRPSKGYWMGPVWMSYPMDILRGLTRHSPESAGKLLDKLLALMLPGGVPAANENYNPLTGLPLECPNFSWNGQLVDILLRDMFGIQWVNGAVQATSAGVPPEWDFWTVKGVHLHGRRYDLHARKSGGTWQHEINAADA